MANVTAKTSSNIFYKARCEAATHNEQLSSREGAADYMSIDRGRLYRIESAEKKAKAVEKDKAAQEAPKPEAKAEKPKKEPEKKETPKKRSNELEGQMDLFSMMGL